MLGLMSDEAREATFETALDAISWRTLEKGDMVAFILGAVERAERKGVAEGIRQARKAARDERRYSTNGYVSLDRLLAAIDALETI